MEKMNSALSLIDNTDTHEFRVKEHKTSKENDTIFNVSKQIIDGTYPYAIDGLIFTPAKLPVFAQYAGRPAKVRKNVRWDKVFKWKPPEQNTIDFLIEATGREYSSDGARVREFKLRVGYNKDNMEIITVKEGVSRINDYRGDPNNITKDINNTENYRFEDYVIDGITQMTHIAIHPDNNCYTEETGELIQDKMVVEFKYNKSEPILANVRRWIPNRIRHDKNESIAEGKISKTANDIEVAMNIWRSIHAPITTNVITGITHLEQNELMDAVVMAGLGTDDKYYNREKKNMQISTPMIFFHNHVIKKFLYEEPTDKKTLLELGCGQGSDMSRWEQSGYRKIVGIDYVRDNIENPVNGVYRRLTDMYKMKHKKNVDARKSPHMIFFIGDCKLPLHDGKSAKVIENNQDSIDFMKIVLGGHRIHDRYKKFNILQQFSDLHKDGFDVVSCQFTIHYFFDTEKSLEGFLNNVVRHLKKGGKFITTYMDGLQVENAISKTETGTAVGKDEKSGAIVWQIVPKYARSNISKKQQYGKQIDVYIENTGKLITENLVYTDMLIKKAEEKGLRVHKQEMFEQTFKNTDKSKLNISGQEKIKEFDSDDTLKQFSFLNKWIIFVKD